MATYAIELALVGGVVFVLLTTQPVPALLRVWLKGRTEQGVPLFIEERVATVSSAAGIFREQGDRVIVRIDTTSGSRKLLVVGSGLQEPDIGAFVRIAYLPYTEQVIEVAPVGGDA